MTRRHMLAVLSAAALVASCGTAHSGPHPSVRSSQRDGASQPNTGSTGQSMDRAAESVTPTGSSRPTTSATNRPSARSVRPDPSISTAAIPDPANVTGTPIGTARAWAMAVNSSSYLDPSPGTWTVRARPFVTGTEAAAERRQSSGGGGSTWTMIQTGKCVTSLRQFAATIPSDAPTGPKRRVVYLTALTTLRCATGQLQLSQFTAQLLLARIDGRWLVTDVHH
jgi:hypothetical protein